MGVYVKGNPKDFVEGKVINVQIVLLEAMQTQNG